MFHSLLNLTSLELRENLLKSLPESVARLTKLERLDIGDNDIEELVSCDHLFHKTHYNGIFRKLFC